MRMAVNDFLQIRRFSAPFDIPLHDIMKQPMLIIVMNTLLSMVNSEQPPSFKETVQRISTLTATINDYMETFSGYPDIFEKMVTKNMLSRCTPVQQDQFLFFKHEHHAFEHYLLSIKYRVAIKKYNY
ncbi:hypothetical protein BDA99DRAFT_539015 [Phascolomyces articulosus]|uniref:Uncharacterized protein n=1 Tax=Phascolomyces articulosus TaxID=60185 RepID=A0AAD5PCK2_9FUNG|nr:hypothetical protein BDA99DRAFT_539015 [Phascolomyces articulosus]